MGLGARFLEWLQSLPPWAWLTAYFARVEARHAEIAPQLRTFLASVEAGYRLDLNLWYGLIFIVYDLTGVRLGEIGTRSLTPDALISDLQQFKADPSLYLAKKLREEASRPGVREVAETVGALITDPVLAIFESYATNPTPDIHEFSRAFHGYMISLGWAGAGIDAALKTTLGDRAPSVAPHLQGIYWSLGLGFLGWQTLAPLLSAGLQPNLERYYNKLYRPERFNASQMRDLFALGKVSATEFQNTLRENGWRDNDIQKWLDISYRDLSESLIFDAYQKGFIGQAELETRLRALGYNPADIPLVLRLNGREDESEATRYLLSTAKTALKNGKIDVSEFRQILTGLHYAPREIDLQIQLLTTQRQEEARDITTGQIKEIYNARIIGADEARANLAQLGYSGDVAAKLVAAWDVELLPKAARINRGTITEGYANGALSRSEALTLLQREAGYSATNAELILKVEEASIRQAGPTTEIGGPAVSLTLLIQFAQNGLITRAQMETRTELARFTPEDRASFISLAFMTPIVEPAQLSPDVLIDAFRRGAITLDALRTRLVALGFSAQDAQTLIDVSTSQLSPSLLSNAYVFGVITRDDFASRLRGAGLSNEDIEVFIRTVELENPQVFGEFVQAFLKRPSIGSLQLALQRGMLTEATFRDRLAGLGYSQDAIEIYLFNAQYQAPASPKTLTKTDILRLYREDKLSRSQALNRLIVEGYTIEDASLLIEAEEQAPEDTEIGQAYLAGLIDQFGAASALQDQGFSFEEIDNFFTRVATGAL